MVGKKHILAVDDDPAMRSLIADYLSEHDFRVSVAADAQEMTRILGEKIIDLIILDLRLTQEDGLELTRELRVKSDVPIIILTGQRMETVDRIIGLALGADDYLTKPFSPRELLARIRAVLRRVAREVAPKNQDKRKAYRFLGWELELWTRRRPDHRQGGGPCDRRGARRLANQGATRFRTGRHPRAGGFRCRPHRRCPPYSAC